METILDIMFWGSFAFCGIILTKATILLSKTTYD